MSIWTEHRNPEGRTYWFNTGTRESVWEKPDELKTPFERALNQTKWKEYFSGGRKYYYNTETKESKWDMPDELLLLLEKVEKEATANQATPTAAVPGRITAGTTPTTTETTATPATQSNGTETAIGAHTGGLPFAPSSILPARPNLPDDPVIPHNGFATFEEGEKAFIHLLKKAGVDANWTWDQTMRAIITDPLYKALNTLAEKKATWQKYTEGLKAKEQEEKEARLAKLRPAIRNMLKGNPNHPIWQQARIESERRLIFEEYVAELKQREVQETRGARSRSIAKVVTLFKQLNVDVVTRWRTAHNMLLESEEWNSDPELRKLPTLDILLAFEDYSRVREREYEEQMRRAQVEKTRRERKAREAFKALMQDLANTGKIKPGTKWKDVYPLFKDDDRYLGILGNPGSNPLELFWDAVDTLDQQLEVKTAAVHEAIMKYNAKLSIASGEGQEPKQFVVGPDTSEEEFLAVVQAEPNEAIRIMEPLHLHDVYSSLHRQAIKKQADEKRRTERRQRHLQDDLRYALKKLPEPLDISLSYEEVVPLIQHLSEYKVIEDDEGRRAAFAKFIKRQKERLREAASEDGGSTTSRKRKESARDHEGEREREWDKEKDRERDRGEKERERDRDRDRDRDRERGKDYEKESRSSRHHHRGYDDHEGHGGRSSRDYGRSDRDRDRDIDKEKDRGKERDKEHRSKHGHHRDVDREDRDKRRKSPRSRDWNGSPHGPRRDERERSASVIKEEPRKRDSYDERVSDERSEKKRRYDEPSDSMSMDETRAAHGARAETPEEGEI